MGQDDDGMLGVEVGQRQGVLGAFDDLKVIGVLSEIKLIFFCRGGDVTFQPPPPNHIGLTRYLPG